MKPQPSGLLCVFLSTALLCCSPGNLPAQQPPQEGGPIPSSQESEINPEIQELLKQGGAAAGTPTASETPTRGPSLREPSPRLLLSPLDAKVTIRLRDVSVSTFLDSLSSQSKINFIQAEGLEGKKITAFLQDMTVREALQVLTETRGLTYRRIGRSNTYVVTRRTAAAPNVVTRIYNLNYIPLQAFSPPKGLSGGSSGGIQVVATGGGGGGPAAEEPGKAEIIEIVESVLSEKTGKVVADPRTNSLIVTDIPEVFPLVDQIIAELDRKVDQVMIEAQIVEIDSDKATQLGLEFGGPRGEIIRYTGPTRVTDYPLRRNIFSQRELGHFFPRTFGTGTGILDPSSGGTGGGTSLGGSGSFFDPAAGISMGVLSLQEFQILLRALVSKGQGRFLSKPKIMTLNNKPAIIQTVTNTAVGVQQQVGGVGTTGLSSVTAERQITGLTLKVTPQINKEEYITMVLEPTLSRPESSEFFPGQFVDPTTRGASSMVRVKNAETIVMGGLIDSRENKTVRKVPILGYIPIVGWLFTSIDSRRTSTDLVIFITPTIVKD